MAQNINIASSQKYEMLKDIFPEKVQQVNFATIDMDVTMLSVADVLRNINRNFPPNTSGRNAIINGTAAVAVLCKTDLLKPIKGLIIVVCDDGASIQLKSRDYIVMGISESTIINNDRIIDMLDKLTTYLIQNYGSVIESFEKFYTLYVYDAYEMED